VRRRGGEEEERKGLEEGLEEREFLLIGC